MLTTAQVRTREEPPRRHAFRRVFLHPLNTLVTRKGAEEERRNRAPVLEPVVADKTAPTSSSPASAESGPSPRSSRARTRRRRRSRRRRRAVVLAIVVGVLAVPGWSLGRTLAANTTDPLSVRVVEWARDHRLGGVVGAIERTWYAHHQPPTGGTPKGGIPRVPNRTVTAPAPPGTRRTWLRRRRTSCPRLPDRCRVKGCGRRADDA